MMREIGSVKGVWLRADGFLCVCLASSVWMCPICGRSIVRALWSPYFGEWVVMRVLTSV